MEALCELDKWSWDGYQERLAAKGYDLYLRKDKKGCHSWLCASQRQHEVQGIGTWKGAQPDCITYQTDMGEITSIQDATSPHYSQQPVVSTSKQYVPIGTQQKPQPVIRQSNPIFEDYTTYKPNSQPTEFEHDGKTYKRYLPDKVLDFFNDEFDYRELANWQDLQNLAMAYFTLIASPYEVTSGGVAAVRSQT